MRNSSTDAPSVAARHIPTKLTRAPASSRPLEKRAISACASKVSGARRTVMSAPAHRRQKGDLVAVRDGVRKILGHALIVDQTGRSLLHRLTQSRFGARDPAFEVRECLHLAWQSDIPQAGGREITEFSQKNEPNHQPPVMDMCRAKAGLAPGTGKRKSCDLGLAATARSIAAFSKA